MTVSDETIISDDLAQKFGDDLRSLIERTADLMCSVEGASRSVVASFLAIQLAADLMTVCTAAGGKASSRMFLEKAIEGLSKSFDVQNTTGKISLKQQDGTTDFPLPKNVVVDYLPHEGDAPAKPMKPTREIINDDIPF